MLLVVEPVTILRRIIYLGAGGGLMPVNQLSPIVALDMEQVAVVALTPLTLYTPLVAEVVLILISFIIYRQMLYRGCLLVIKPLQTLTVANALLVSVNPQYYF